MKMEKYIDKISGEELIKISYVYKLDGYWMSGYYHKKRPIIDGLILVLYKILNKFIKKLNSNILDKLIDNVLFNSTIKYHRLDGPAVEYFDGLKEWYVDGKRHREDGPAVIWSSNRVDYFLNGDYIKNVNEYIILLRKLKMKNL